MQNEKCKTRKTFFKKDVPRFAFLIFNFAFLSSCVPVPPELLPDAPAGSATTSGMAYPDLDSGSLSITTSHFTFKGYTEYDMRTVSAAAEAIYDRIDADTGLHGYMTAGNYQIVLYSGPEEYIRKTRQPTWSRAISASGTIYTFSGPDLEPVLAHEMTHLVFNGYMGEQARTLRWLNEGLAMVEEVNRMPAGEKAAFQNAQREQLLKEKIPFSRMTFFMPDSEEKRRSEGWYLQVHSVTTFLLGQGSSLAFAGFLSSLRNGIDIDRALDTNYPGRIRNFNDLETLWKTNN